ncbi:MAG: DUF6672 family protein [Cetobacterium sp.]
MRKSISFIIFFLGIIFVSGVLFYSGQEHTLVINNVYSKKNESKNIVVKIDGEKEKKVGKNKKVVMNLKGKKHNLTLIIDGLERQEVIKFNLNKSAEISLENLVVKDKKWLKIISQY